MTGAFLQTEAAQVLKKLVLSQETMLDVDRQDIMAFLSGGQEGQYVPQSGQIVGVLKTIRDLMSKGLAEAGASESASITSHDQLMAAKMKEVNANSNAVESKTLRQGQLAMSIAQMSTDLSNTEAALVEDKAFLADLDSNCATQTKEWEERTKTRSDELSTLAETISALNSDDALELFKKALPSASSSFIQMAESKRITRKSALSMIHAVRVKSSHRPQFDFIALAMQGKQPGFEKVVKMIDGMTATLKTEQKDDDGKVAYCGKQFESADDKKKSLAKTISDLDISIQEATDGVATLKQEIDALEDGIKKLDESVTEATEQRQSEHSSFTASMASDSAAKELLKFATNRLQKFYKPSLYSPPKASAAVFAQVSSHAHQQDAPAAPPATFDAYAKKKDDSDGVLELLSLLEKGLDKDMTEAKAAEQDGQKEYEQMLRDSAEKRTLDSKSLTDKNVAKASMEADIEASKDGKASTGKEMMATDKYVASLHTSCDWLLQYYDVRKQARASEVDSLANAKGVLSGVDFSLLQKQSHNLRRRQL